MLVDDVLLSGEARDSFAKRQQAVQETARLYELGRKKYLVAIGTGALAAYGLDAHVMLPYGDPFDLDLIDLRDPRPNPRTTFRWTPPEAPLPVSAQRRQDLPWLTRLRTEGSEDVDILDRATRSPNDFGFMAVRPVDAAASKVQRGDIKDIVGIVQAHIVGFKERHPIRSIVETPEWRRVVGAALYELLDDEPSYYLPDWTRDLIKGDVRRHPALRDIPIPSRPQ